MLNDMNVRCIYDSAECSIVKELLVPALSQSHEYWRGVGYFSSGWLQLTAEGIEQIAKKGGKIRFIVSPLISPEDYNAFVLAFQAQNNKYIISALQKNLSEIALNLRVDTLNTFAWLLADNIIEFKFAIPKITTEGDYHDKVGICIDENNQKLAFHGSFNDTYKGSLNGEAFSVFCSWVSGQEIYTEQHFNRLKKMWDNGNSQFDVLPFDEALKREFINLRNAERPYKLPYRDINMNRTIQHKTPSIPYILKDYQKEAVAAWKNNAFHGIFEMATGTGKTITSLAACVDLFEDRKKLFLVIVVPFTHLLEQWKENCTRFNIDVLPCFGGNSNWQRDLRDLILRFKIGGIKLPCIIAVQNTAASSAFLSLIQKIPSQDFMMIADETHYLGAKHLRNALFPTATFRLGLSATPSRWMDSWGTQILYNYYDKTVYTITLDQAIDGHHLTPYEYNPILVKLTMDEVDKYTVLSQEISKTALILSGNDYDPSLEDRLKMLLLKRAKIIAQAKNKLNAYQNLLTRLKLEHGEERLKKLLVFCAPGTHRQVLKLTNSLGIKAHEFVHKVEPSTRNAVLNSFSNDDIEAIISIKCMDEGVDVPSTETAIFIASTTNPKEFIQRRGRVLRKSPGKKFAKIYDFIVVPPDDIDEDTAESIFKRELPRFSEFANSAKNKYKAREILWDVLERWGLAMYIDIEPWNVYNQEQWEG